MVVSGHHTNVRLEMSDSQEKLSLIKNPVIAAIFWINRDVGLVMNFGPGDWKHLICGIDQEMEGCL